MLMLHGTGGDERDLLPLGRELRPGAALLGVRGKVLENGMPRFFRRFAEGVLDVEDLESRTEELAHFIDGASERYDFSKKKLIVVGYSNGANIAARLVLLHPHYLAAAILFRAIVPFVPDLIRDFSHLSVFIGAASSHSRINTLSSANEAIFLVGDPRDVRLELDRDPQRTWSRGVGDGASLPSSPGRGVSSPSSFA